MAEMCDKEERQEQRLSDVFDDALISYEEIIKNERTWSHCNLQLKIGNCILTLENITQLINAAGVFSSNETLEEIPTSNIKYLLIPALLGSLVLKAQPTDRVNALETAEVYYKDFLKRLQDYEIIPPVKELEDEEESNASSKKVTLIDLAIQRNEIIRRYREQKEAEEELKRLKSLMIKGDDETCRNYYLKYVRNFVYTALEELKMIKEEKPLAEHLAETRGKASTYVQRHLEEKHYIRPNFKPIIITRNELQKKIFGAGYPSLPTMTVDEFYRERVAEGIFPAQGSSHGKVLQELTDPEVVKREEEKEEIEKENEIESDDPKYLEKTRNMDDFKDDHPRGWGNRMNRG